MAEKKPDPTAAALATAFWKATTPKSEPEFRQTPLADLAEILDDDE